MEKRSAINKLEKFLRFPGNRLLPLVTLVLVTLTFAFRWGGMDLRSIWHTTFYLAAFVYFLAFIYRASWIYDIRNVFVFIGVISVVFGGLIIATARVLYNVTGEEFIPDSLLNLGFATGLMLIWLGTLVFAPSYCILVIQRELTPDSANRLVSFIRRNTTASLIWASFLGIILYAVYRFTKDAIWRSGTLADIFFNLVNPSSNAGFVSLNLFIDVTSALPAIILCAYLLITVLINKEKIFDLVMAASYLLAGLNPWNITEAPNAVTRISLVAGSAMNAVVIVLTIWLLIWVRRNDKLKFLWHSLK